MDAGRLRDVVVLQAATQTKDVEGGMVVLWSGSQPIRANVRFGSGKEAISKGFQTGQVTISVRIRTGIPVDTAMRVLYQGRDFDIEQVLPGGERMEYTDLVCVHGQPERI